MNHLWKTLGIVLLIGSVGWGTFNVVAVLAHEEHVETRTFPAEGIDAVSIHSADGSVSVSASDGDEIVVTAHVSDGWRRSGNHQEIVGDELRIESSCPLLTDQWCDVDYTVEVPSHVSLDITANIGTVEVRGIHGPITIDNDQGAIDVDDTRGPLRLSNDNGRIAATRVASSVAEVDNDHGSIELAFVEVPRTVTVENDNGPIEIAVPDTADAYDVDVDINDGEAEELVRIDPTSDRTIRVDSDHGDVTVRYAG